MSFVLALRKEGAVDIVHCPRPGETGNSRHCPWSSPCRGQERKTLSSVLALSRGEPWTQAIVLALSRGGAEDIVQCPRLVEGGSRGHRPLYSPCRGGSRGTHPNSTDGPCPAQIHRWPFDLRKEGWVRPQILGPSVELGRVPSAPQFHR